MSDDPIEILKQHVEYWETTARAAREQLAVADAVLPGLKEQLARFVAPAYKVIDVTGLDIPGLRIPNDEGAAESPEDELGPDAPAAGQTELRNADEASKAARQVIPELPERFAQSDVHASFGRLGLFVNRSTLRGSLQALANEGDIIAIAEPGRGRRATIFRKL